MWEFNSSLLLLFVRKKRVDAVSVRSLNTDEDAFIIRINLVQNVSVIDRSSQPVLPEGMGTVRQSHF